MWRKRTSRLNHAPLITRRATRGFSAPLGIKYEKTLTKTITSLCLLARARALWDHYVTTKHQVDGISSRVEHTENLFGANTAPRGWTGRSSYGRVAQCHLSWLPGRVCFEVGESCHAQSSTVRAIYRLASGCFEGVGFVVQLLRQRRRCKVVHVQMGRKRSSQQQNNLLPFF